ncbi:YbhB/YbcL family Raf kinase inhibitor-like protein [Moraxella sp.]|uniref:YbhB/YbcL family Raf kinase inhibitor-like protein n=1 Tax=Moraxella sp. TaxID=479 RepID=UPI0026DAE06E|nr:YbhB/YbcL family Raf kinase inhibitor-like protein [Moraxella sp.]MDO4894241.1 YbhB/YbcL family Raf kinase inhibitor-like protein [Moraxella sp.]
MNYSELIKTLITDLIEIADELWVFKIEIFKHSNGYFASVWRLDTYNINPTFASQKDWIASETFFIDESYRIDGLGLIGDRIYFKSLDECQTYVLNCLNQTFNIKEIDMNDLSLNTYLDVRNPAQNQGDMLLFCADINEGDTLSNDYVANIWGYTGNNISPELQWKNAPSDTKSFVLTMYDPDAPTGCGFWHWNVFNIPAEFDKLPKGQSNEFGAGIIELKNDAGLDGFIGAFPPKGDKPHRYIFTLYALNEMLDLPNSISPAVLGFNLNGKVLASASLTAYYHW